MMMIMMTIKVSLMMTSSSVINCSHRTLVLMSYWIMMIMIVLIIILIGNFGRCRFITIVGSATELCRKNASTFHTEAWKWSTWTLDIIGSKDIIHFLIVATESDSTWGHTRQAVQSFVECHHTSIVIPIDSFHLVNLFGPFHTASIVFNRGWITTNCRYRIKIDE